VGTKRHPTRARALARTPAPPTLGVGWLGWCVLGCLAVGAYGVGLKHALPSLLSERSASPPEVVPLRSHGARPARALGPATLIPQPAHAPTRLAGAVEASTQGSAAATASATSTTHHDERAASRSPRSASRRVASWGHYRARAALIIDDCGNNWRHAEGFVHAPLPLTLAVLPHLPYSVYIANEAHAAGKGVMLHFPMEASGPTDPGPGTLRLAMSPAERSRIIASNLEAVPHLEGVNNHEGSKVTADEPTMLEVLTAVKQRNLFFVDSLTSPRSCVALAAGRVGLRFSRRDVFIDNQDEVEAIKDQLRELIEDSLDRGEAIGIGHARPGTLTAILEMAPAFEESGIKLILARDLKPLRAEVRSPSSGLRGRPEVWGLRAPAAWSPGQALPRGGEGGRVTRREGSRGAAGVRPCALASRPHVGGGRT
jgi:uncharacterized protein